MGETPLDDKMRQLLLEVQAFNGEWCSRMDIAHHLSKTRLNNEQITLLDLLAQLGKIERAMRTLPDKPQVNRWEYRSKKE